jgi:hypothetical protein
MESKTKQNILLGKQKKNKMFSILKKRNVDIQSQKPVFGPYKTLQNEW